MFLLAVFRPGIDDTFLSARLIPQMQSPLPAGATRVIHVRRYVIFKRDSHINPNASKTFW